MKAHMKTDKCKYCGKNTSNLDFVAYDPDTKSYYNVCVDCLKKMQKGDKV